MRRAGLLARLEKLESKRSAGLPDLRVIHGIVDSDINSALGFQAGKRAFLKAPGETVDACAARAFANGAAIIGAIYPATVSEATPRRVEAAEPSQPPADAAKGAPSDPFALAGIGKRATAEQLAHMIGGVPPERLL